MRTEVRRMRALGFVAGMSMLSVAALNTGSAWAADEQPARMAAVISYLMKVDYPELFKDKPYRTRIENISVADVDNDGVEDVYVHYFPHFRQSPTIVFFKLDAELKVTRVKEGLAPGPLVALTGDFMDSHALGLGVDMKVGGGKKIESEEFVGMALQTFGSVVAYRDFFHVDMRSGGGTYVDMISVGSVPGKDTCAKFEFSRVKAIAVGPVVGETKNSLAAWVGDEIWLYSINAFRKNGMLEKQIQVVPAPEGFKGFIPGLGLTYQSSKGAPEQLARSERKN